MESAEKRLAAMCAIKSGLCTKTENGHDIEKFEKFWDLFTKAKKSVQNECGIVSNKYSYVGLYLSGISTGAAISAIIISIIKLCY